MRVFVGVWDVGTFIRVWLRVCVYACLCESAHYQYFHKGRLLLITFVRIYCSSIGKCLFVFVLQLTISNNRTPKL